MKILEIFLLSAMLNVLHQKQSTDSHKAVHIGHFLDFEIYLSSSLEKIQVKDETEMLESHAAWSHLQKSSNVSVKQE